MRSTLLAGLLLLAAPAAAQPIRAVYSVEAAGMSVLQVDAAVDLARRDGYAIETRLRTVGLAARLFPGEQTTTVNGAWLADGARPIRYLAEGIWRGQPRRVALDYANGQPVSRVIEPPNTEERETVPPELAQDTVDSLSAFALLARRTAEIGRCDGEIAVFDGRRRLDYRASTEGWFTLPGARGFQAGPLLRCRLEGRQVAGFRVGEDRSAQSRPQRGLAWFAAPQGGTTALPVRVEFETRFAGRVLAELRELTPAR